MREPAIDCCEEPFFALTNARLAATLFVPFIGMMVLRLINAQWLAGMCGFVSVSYGVSAVCSMFLVLFSPRFYRGHLVANGSCIAIFVAMVAWHFISRSMSVVHEKAGDSDDLSGLVLLMGSFVYSVSVPILFIGCLSHSHKHSES